MKTVITASGDKAVWCHTAVNSQEDCFILKQHIIQQAPIIDAGEVFILVWTKLSRLQEWKWKKKRKMNCGEMIKVQTDKNTTKKICSDWVCVCVRVWQPGREESSQRGRFSAECHRWNYLSVCTSTISVLKCHWEQFNVNVKKWVISTTRRTVNVSCLTGARAAVYMLVCMIERGEGKILDCLCR